MSDNLNDGYVSPPMCQNCEKRPATAFYPDGITMLCPVCAPQHDEVSGTEAGDPEAWVDTTKWAACAGGVATNEVHIWNGEQITDPALIEYIKSHPGECGLAQRFIVGGWNGEKITDPAFGHPLPPEALDASVQRAWDAFTPDYGAINQKWREQMESAGVDPDAPQDDPVNHPSHYTSHPSGVECIDITEHYSFCIGNAMKYLWRCDLKHADALEDLRKAAFYVNREISLREREAAK